MATPQPSIMMPVWPVGTKTAESPAARAASTELERHAHLADGAVGADGEDDVAAGAMRAARGDLVALRRAPVVDQLDAMGRREGGELGILGDELMQAGDDVQACLDGGTDGGPPVGRDAAALRRDADEERRGLPGRLVCQSVGQARHDGDVTVGPQPVADVAPGLAAVEHRDHRVPPVADDAHGRLRGQFPEGSLGQDGVAARVRGHGGRSQPAHCTGGVEGRRTPPGRGPGA